MNRVVDYIEAAERDNTRRSYASAIRHFEIEWKGLLPSTADAIARYLADYAPTLAINTLRQRLAALSRWHADQGFADPTKSPLVRQVDRKSTRLNSSHLVISYAVFCLKKKKKNTTTDASPTVHLDLKDVQAANRRLRLLKSRTDPTASRSSTNVARRLHIESRICSCSR